MGVGEASNLVRCNSDTSLMVNFEGKGKDAQLFASYLNKVKLYNNWDCNNHLIDDYD